MTRTDENLTREDAEARSHLLSNLRYEVHVDLTDDHRDTFETTSRVRFDAAEIGATTFVDVTAAEIVSAQLNGHPVEDVEAYAGSRLALSGLRTHNELTVRARHRYSREGKGMHRFVDPVDDAVYLHTQFEPNHAHEVFACFDQPDLKGRFGLTVRAPAGWRVVSNAHAEHVTGPDVDELVHGVGAPPVACDEDARTWGFATTAPMSPYITAIVAGPYHAARDRHGDTPLGIYGRASLMPHIEADEIFEITRQGLDFFADVFGQVYPWGKYDQLFVPEFSAGAMENAGAVTFNESYVYRSQVTDAARESRAETILHEMAHMWFGDLVTMRWWDDLWLNESFATYVSYLALERATRFTDAWVTFNDDLKAWAKHEDQLPTTHPIEAQVPDSRSVHQNFDGITYAKGASVLKQLVAWVGEHAFVEGCRRYFEQHAYGNATLEDFLGALEQASGRDLTSWTQRWLRTPGINTLRADVQAAGGRYERVTIAQEAAASTPTLREHRLVVGAYRRHEGRLRRSERVELDVTGPVTPVEALVGAPVPELLLINDEDLTYAKIALDGASVSTLTTDLRELDDALARSLCWGALWDAVRDAEVPTRTFIDAVANNAEDEADVGVLQTLLRRARSATDLYAAPEHRDQLLDRLRSHAQAAVRSAEPGSDEQLAWTRHWAECCRDAGSAAPLGDLLDGELVLEGLTVDTDLRWHLLRCLVAADAIGDEAVDAELRRDPTDMGQRYAAAARASRPQAAAKQQAWERVTVGDEVSHTMAKAVMRGFLRLDQAQVLAPYVERYFDELPRIWDERNLDWALDASRLLFPLFAVDGDLLERVDVYLEGDPPPPLRRLLREERDTVSRARLARARDRTSTD